MALEHFGTKSFLEFVSLHRNVQKSGCFIATAVYGEDASELELLRGFRDQYLMRSQLGRLFVLSYYLCSPYLAAVIAKSVMVREFVKNLFLKPMCVLIGRVMLRWKLP